VLENNLTTACHTSPQEIGKGRVQSTGEQSLHKDSWFCFYFWWY
jgi:hypothetical protein